MTDDSFKEKLRSLQFSKGNRGTTTRKPVIDEDTGRVGGHHVEHWDDSQDAEINLSTVKVKATHVKEGT